MNGLEKQNRLHPVYHTGRRGGNLFAGIRGKMRGVSRWVQVEAGDGGTGGGAAIFLRESAEKGTGELDKKTGVFVK